MKSNRITRFLSAICREWIPSPRESFMIFVATLIFGFPIVGLVFLVAWVLAWTTGKPFDGDAMSAAVAVLFVFFTLGCVTDYLVKKWKETK